MKRMITKYPISTLIALAILAGLLWRIEVELHSWTGLIWLSYFHLAIPVGFGLFLFWANQFLKLNWKNRVYINISAILYGILIYYGLGASLTSIFASGPSEFVLMMQTPEWKMNLFRYSIFLLIPLIPIGAYFIMKVFKRNPPVKFLIFSILGTIASIPISVLILEVIDHKGGPDLINTIKSGMLIPFWVCSIGLLIIGQNIKNRTENTIV